MKTWAVWVKTENRDIRIGKVTAKSEHDAMIMIPDKYFKMGNVALVPIIIES